MNTNFTGRIVLLYLFIFSFLLNFSAQYESELHKYGGGLMEMEARDSSSVASDLKQGGVSSKTTTDTVVASTLLSPHMDGYHIGGVPSQRPSILVQRPSLRPLQKWKGPDKISRIYGDWIDDVE